MTRLERMLAGTPYAGYAYAYPHKTAYRPLERPVPLREAWTGEDRSAVFLYIHVPFCEMRCGFCNLFTTANPAAEVEGRYLDALRREAAQAQEAIGPAHVARMAVGGGTPTYLPATALDAVFDLAQELLGADPRDISASVETSPQTATPERLQVLHDRGVERISIGVQSFTEEETRAAGRPQRVTDVEMALERIRNAAFPVLNLDLIYGLPGQTEDSWRASLRAALRYAPEELYLYPLYVRPLTGLDRRGARTWDEQRLALYRSGRDFLLEAGYAQLSMRSFRRTPEHPNTRTPEHLNTRTPEYCCQEDGMIGLGCGARSYTRALHYSQEYAVGARGVREILAEYLQRPAEAFARAEYGFQLDPEEQRRRYAIKSLLRCEGLSLVAYRARFGSEAGEDLPELQELPEHGLARQESGCLCLTEAGLERSDTLGPWLYSEAVRRRSEAFELR